MVCLAPGRNEDLRALVRQRVIALELADDRVLELGDAFHRRIAREAAADRLDAGIRDLRGRVEIRLADAEPDDVLALRLEPATRRSARRWARA